MKPRQLLLTILVTISTAAFALDFHLSPRVFALIPLGEDSAGTYTAGGGGSLHFDVDFASIWRNPFGFGYAAGVEGGYAFAPLSSGGGDSLSLLSGGGGLSLYYYPLSRFAVRLDGAAGIYQGTLDDSTASWYWRAGAGAGFRFSPNVILLASGGYSYFNNHFAGASNSPAAGKDSSPQALYQGIYAGLTVQFIFETRSAQNEDKGVTVTVKQDEPLYPVFLSMYQTNQAAALVIRNNESAEIRDIRVSFRAASYTASEFPCAEIKRLGKRQSAEAPLYADLTAAVLGFTENGRIAGEVVIRYTLLGKQRESVQSATVQVHNRNAFPGGDPAGLAAFVSPASAEILEYTKYIVGMARNERRTGLSQNMQFAVWLFEGLRVRGMTAEKSETAEIQFPAQTLAYRSGTALDAALLYAAILEAAGINAAIIPMDNGCLTALSLGISETAAAALFNGTDRLLIINGEVWLPLAMDKIAEGFTAAWAAGAQTLNDLEASDEAADLVLLDDAWAAYPPAPFPPLGARMELPNAAALGKNANAAMDAYITQELVPLISATQRQIQTAPTAALYNRLGLLQTRAGRLAEAKASYERAAGMGLVTGMINRGNIALIEKDYATAERWFRQALQAQPDSAAAQKGLEQAADGRQANQ